MRGDARDARDSPKKWKRREEVKKKSDGDLVALFFAPRNRPTSIECKSSDSAAVLSFGGRVKKDSFYQQYNFQLDKYKIRKENNELGSRRQNNIYSVLNSQSKGLYLYVQLHAQKIDLKKFNELLSCVWRMSITEKSFREKKLVCSVNKTTIFKEKEKDLAQPSTLDTPGIAKGLTMILQCCFFNSDP